MKKIIGSLFLATVVTGFPCLAQNTNAPAVPKGGFHEVEVNGIKGYQDTPMEPNGLWHVHDPARTQPPVVTPGAAFSPQAAAPSDAIVLFDGKDLSRWKDRGGNPAPWIVKDGEAVTTKSDIVTKQEFGDIQLHLEFREPTPASGTGQGRGNSGVFFMGRYEIQVLDCFENKTYPDGTTGAIYAQHPPLANACRPPGEWETYDIIFTVPHFGENGKLITPAYATVILNGVVVQNHQAIRGNTDHCTVGQYTYFGPTGPLGLQFHHNAIAFRNIWVRPLAEANEP
jgi:hypothetical protein